MSHPESLGKDCIETHYPRKEKNRIEKGHPVLDESDFFDRGENKEPSEMQVTAQESPDTLFLNQLFCRQYTKLSEEGMFFNVHRFCSQNRNLVPPSPPT